MSPNFYLDWLEIVPTWGRIRLRLTILQIKKQRAFHLTARFISISHMTISWVASWSMYQQNHKCKMFRGFRLAYQTFICYCRDRLRMISILSAMGLKHTSALPTEGPPDCDREWKISAIVPFAARFTTEKLLCEKGKEWVRFMLVEFFFSSLNDLSIFTAVWSDWDLESRIEWGYIACAVL